METSTEQDAVVSDAGASRFFEDFDAGMTIPRPRGVDPLRAPAPLPITSVGATETGHARVTTGFVAEADVAIDAVAEAGHDLAVATVREMQLSDGRAEQKSAAIVRLMSIENPETKKPHSASSAEKVVEFDAQYMTYRRNEHAAVVARIQAEAALSSAKLRARLAVTLAEATL